MPKSPNLLANQQLTAFLKTLHLDIYWEQIPQRLYVVIYQKKKNCYKSSPITTKIGARSIVHSICVLWKGDGFFSRQQKIVITFSESDYNLAVLLKKQFSCGRIYKIKDKKAFNWIISKKSDVVRLHSSFIQFVFQNTN